LEQFPLFLTISFHPFLLLFVWVFCVYGFVVVVFSARDWTQGLESALPLSYIPTHHLLAWLTLSAEHILL
jgi:hypothetical protein